MANRVAEILGTAKPIIQAPMFWLTDAKLVAAVSNAGGLGVLGFNAGQTVPTRDIDETIARMRREIQKTRTLTDKPFGLNFSGGEPDKDPFATPMFDLIVSEKVPVAVIAGDLVPIWIKKFHENGIKVVFRALNPTPDNTRQAAEAGADIIVATGFDEGGTLPNKPIGTFAAVPMVVDAAQGVPVMAAGAISDARTAKAAYALGAEGLYVGTAFLLSKESRLADNIKQQAIAADATDSLFYRTNPAYYRSLPGELPDRLQKLSDNGKSRGEIYEEQNGMAGMREGMLVGDLTKGYASFGLGLTQIKSIDSVATIMARLDVEK